jgi:hypothetical protein
MASQRSQEGHECSKNGEQRAAPILLLLIDVPLNMNVRSLIPTRTLREKGFASLSRRDRVRELT